MVKGFNVLHNLTVDTMTLTGDMVLWLHIRGHHSYFRSEGHYPVLAAVGKSQRQYYVAAVKVQHMYYFTYVENGASSVTYKDEIGEEHKARDFFVLARRHREDSTLVWRGFWPRTDPNHCAVSESAKQDDSHLESLLNSFNGVSSAIF